MTVIVIVIHHCAPVALLFCHSCRPPFSISLEQLDATYGFHFRPLSLLLLSASLDSAALVLPRDLMHGPLRNMPILISVNEELSVYFSLTYTSEL